MSQSFARLYVHAVYSTKGREPVLAAEWRDELHGVLGGAANALGCPTLAVGGTADHVHHLFALARTVTPADAVGKTKAMASAWVNRTHRPAPEFQWQAGYAAFSVSQSNVDAVREYIRHQERHHAGRTYQDEVRDWLSRYGLEWDERYVWD